MAWIWPSEYGYGYGPTQLLVDKLKWAQKEKASFPFDYSFTIVTDHGNYGIPIGDDPNQTQILDVDREFLTIQISINDLGKRWEKVYVRLCTIRAIQEHYTLTE